MNATWPPKRILLPYDFSDHSEHALAYAGELAAAHGAHLYVLHAGPPVPPIITPLPDGVAAQAKIWSDMLAQREAIQVAEIEKAVGPLREKLTISIVWREGDPVNVVVDTADELDVDLVIMGSHGRTGMKRALLGSVAERTVRLCGRPVLVLR